MYTLTANSLQQQLPGTTCLMKLDLRYSLYCPCSWMIDALMSPDTFKCARFREYLITITHRDFFLILLCWSNHLCKQASAFSLSLKATHSILSFEDPADVIWHVLIHIHQFSVCFNYLVYKSVNVFKFQCEWSETFTRNTIKTWTELTQH